MKIKSAEIITSAAKFSQLPAPDRLELVLIGKSNVGKSSFINSLLSRKSLARTSSVPGKTRTANYYLINDSFYIVDMPGYGYAKASKKDKAVFSRLIYDYLDRRQTDFIVFFLVDMRHEPTANDLKMFDDLVSRDIYPVVILTKADKVSRNRRMNNIRKIKNAFDLDDDDLVIPFSTEENLGKKEVWNFIENYV